MTADGGSDRSDPIDAADQRALDRHVSGASSAHQRLLAGLDSIDPAVLAGSSVPGSSVAGSRTSADIVVALIQQADQQLALFDSAADAAPDPLSRLMAAVADDGAAAEFGAPFERASWVAELRRSIWSLEMAWSQTEHWSWERAESVFVRWRAVELAHLELSDHLEGLEAGLDTLPSDYVREELRRAEMLWRARRPMGMTTLPGAVLALEPAERLGWFLGRVAVAGVEPAGIELGVIDRTR